jgi:hypothetical protein
MATQLVKLRPYKTTVIHALQPYFPTNGVHLCSWFLHSTLFSDETWFHLQGCINTQNICYWNSQNSHLTREVQLHAVKVISCAVSARSIVVPVFLMKQLIVKDIYG